MDESLAAVCSPPAVQVPADGSTFNTIQAAYDYASGLGQPDFTLKLSGETLTEDLVLDGGAVTFDGGYDCDFIARASQPTGLLGKITISSGSANFAGGIRVVSLPQCSFDADGDGFSVGSCAIGPLDCDDNNPAVNPDAPEICDGLDNNCDGQVDEGISLVDADGDGYYSTGCGGLAGDCNDNNSAIYPGAAEIPFDGIDQDCDGSDLTFAGESCAGCHNLSTIAGRHDLTAAPDGTCASCHTPYVSNILPSHYGDTVRTAGNNMAAGSIIGCAACHDADAANHSGGIALGNGSNFVGVKVSADWPNITCDTCHETRAAGHTTATAHNNRVIDPTCATCHTSDTTTLGSAGNGSLTNDAHVDTLHRSDCALCHNYNGTILNAGLVRQAIELGQSGTQISCLNCHTDKGSGHGNFTHPVEVGPNDLTSDLKPCGNCHAVATWAEIEAIEHNVPTNGTTSCDTCHKSTRQEVVDVIFNGTSPTKPVIYCLDCHSAKGGLPAHGNVDHADPLNGYVTIETACAVCHPDPATTFTSGTDNRVHDDCTTCHDAATNALIGSAVGHEVVTGQNTCTTCHTGRDWTDHDIDHATDGYVTLHSECTSCHATTLTAGQGFISAADDAKHNACTSCHDADGAIATGSVDCSACHSGVTTDWATHSQDHTLKVTSAIGCTSCHSATVDYVAFVDPANNLKHDTCYACHDATSKLASAAAGDCSQCHSGVTGDFTTHTTQDHTTAVTQQAECSSCHTATVDYANFIDAANNMKHDSCTTCHDANTNAPAATAGDCSQCHTDTWVAMHFAANNGTTTHNTLVRVDATSCASCHTDPPPLTDAADAKVHNACVTCHNANGSLIATSSAFGKTFTTGGNCATCHDNPWDVTHNGHSHTVTLGTGDLSNGSSCATCHDDSNGALASWTDVYVEHLSDCATCHSSTRTEVVNAISAGNPTNCLTCHSSKAAAHGNVDHVANNLVTLANSCAACHDPGSAANATVDVTHSGNCNFCHIASIPDLKSGLQAGDCTTCHGSTGHATAEPFNNCDSCHNSMAPGGGTHSTHESVRSCADCHNTPTPACNDCHDFSGGPGGNNLHTSRWNHENTDCTTCHISGSPMGAIAVPWAKCAQCHTDKHTRALYGGRDHDDHISVGQNNGSDCNYCHAPDAASPPPPAPCFGCHFENSTFRVHDKHDGRADCIDCHSNSNPSSSNL